MNLKNHFIIFILIFSPVILCLGQSTSTQLKIFDNESPLKINVRTDMMKLLSHREDEDDYIDAMVKVEGEKDFQTELPVEINTRGNFRRDSSNCEFPPLRLNFKKKDIDGTYFEGNDKIKIVTHCKNNVPEFIQFISREYITYKIYNLLTPVSFQVRYAIITYEDTENQMPMMTRKAFIIEDIDHLAARNNMEEYEGQLEISDLNQKNAITISLFQYMIGNTDWIVNLSKNLKIVTDNTEYFAVPYDFDYTAIVGTDYSLGGGVSYLSEPVKEYKGECYPLNDIREIADKFLEAKKEINKLIRKSDYLDYTSRDKMRSYLSDFFYTIRKDNRIQEEVLQKCNN